MKFVESLIEKQNTPESLKKREFGSHPGMFKMAEDFDAPLDDFKDYM